MDKVIIRVGYNDYLIPVKDALEVARILNSAECYQTKGYGEEQTVHVWTNPKPVIKGFEFITEDMYRMAKLAGQPVKE